MSRNLKVLGLVPIAVLVMAAANPAVSMAFKFKSEKAPVTLAGTMEGSDTFTFAYGKTVCKEATFTGTKAATETDAIALAPVYAGCTTAGLPSTVNMGKCLYEYSGLEAEGLWGDMDINCPGAEKIVITAAVAGVTKCTITLEDQIYPEEALFTNLGMLANREITVETNTGSVKYVQHEGVGVGKCAAVETSKGSYAGKLRVKAEEGKVQVGIWAE